jgi:short-chain Z-isoprenyl diphosphate synthase
MKAVLPRHLGVMPDGTRRWAARTGLSTDAGYREGAAHLLRFYSWCDEVGIDSVTVWLFTERNALQRPPEQLAGLLRVCEKHAWEAAKQQRWRVRVVGNMAVLPGWFAASVQHAVDTTAQLQAPELRLGMALGGRSEILKAVLACRDAAADGEVTEDDVTDYLAQRQQPELDLIIRSSGEQRISDMGTWQVAWAEMYFAQPLWQDFTRADLQQALDWYAARCRRRGS